VPYFNYSGISISRTLSTQQFEPQARFAYKRSTKWVGYKVHLTETCDEETPNIITNVQTECATFNDSYSLPKIHEQLSQAELLPDKHLVDAGYIEASNLVESRREYDIDLVGSAQSNGRWQQVQGNGFDISNFRVEWDREKVICPAGREKTRRSAFARVTQPLSA